MYGVPDPCHVYNTGIPVAPCGSYMGVPDPCHVYNTGIPVAPCGLCMGVPDPCHVYNTGIPVAPCGSCMECLIPVMLQMHRLCDWCVNILQHM